MTLVTWPLLWNGLWNLIQSSLATWLERVLPPFSAQQAGGQSPRWSSGSAEGPSRALGDRDSQGWAREFQGTEQASPGPLGLSPPLPLVLPSLPEVAASCFPPPSSSGTWRVWGRLLPGTHGGSHMRGLTPPWSTNSCHTCGSKPVLWLLFCSNHMSSFPLHPSWPVGKGCGKACVFGVLCGYGQRWC